VRYDVRTTRECPLHGRLVDFAPARRIVRPVVHEPLLSGKVDGRVRIEAEMREDLIFGPNVGARRQLP
jgi:hypothetical protein